ncbi:MAG: hypothetical protein NC344_10145 [Bacteroidales bacterium]|nr:hypothetical protein [Bacteroidales bacterium]MCM1148164.1 hypothetical protein [Bacteroidales bacterium]MCM1207109.1 hypothetical protein [Bacillota bacterium]MCM1510861.1 hypothetical protein [Clostridium sp.]
MKKKVLGAVKKLAREAGYHDVRYLGMWSGYEVAEPIFTDGEVRYTGLPQYILVKDGVMRWTSDADESIAIMEAF